MDHSEEVEAKETWQCSTSKDHKQIHARNGIARESQPLSKTRLESLQSFSLQVNFHKHKLGILFELQELNE
jgi:hypothetical protein